MIAKCNGLATPVKGVVSKNPGTRVSYGPS